MKLPDGWPRTKVPKGWPEPRFDPRLVQAAQNVRYNESIVSFETRLRNLFGRSDVGAMITLPYIHDPDLRRFHCLVARYYGLRPVRHSTICFATKDWRPPVYKVEDIPLNRAIEPSETGCELTDSKMPPSPGGGETTSRAERSLEQIQVEAGCTSVMGIDDPDKSPQKKAMSESRSTKYEPRWKSPDDMIFSLNNSPGMRLEAICALYRHVRRIREEMAFRLSESQFEKIACIVEALTDGNALGPCIRTPEELEDIYNGSNAFCSWLVYTYSSKMYHIYVTKMDEYFC